MENAQIVLGFMVDKSVTFLGMAAMKIRGKRFTTFYKKDYPLGIFEKYQLQI
jgi:hypothetical protein